MNETVRISYFNEVHIKIHCEPSTAMEIADKFTFTVPGAKFSPAYKNKVWDGKIRLFNPMTCLLYAGLRDELEQFCKSRDYDIEYENIANDTEFSSHEAEEFVSKLQPKYTPRDYQYAAFIHAVRKRRSLILSPTGSGKSLIIYLLACYYQTKTLIIVPTTSLVHQMASDFEDYGMPKKMIHKIMSGEEKTTDSHIVISTWQSIYKLPKPWFKQFNLVIGDEAHLFKAKSLTAIMTKLDQCKHRYGFTGTLDGTQTNKMVLEGLFGAVKKFVTTAELMEKKQLAELTIKSILLNYPEESRKLVRNLDYHDEMDFLVRNESRNRFIKNLALSLKGNTLLLFQYVEKHGKVLFDMINKEAENRKVFFISGKVDGEEREEIRKIIETEENAIVVASYGTSSTGINVRNLSNVIFASPSKSMIRVLQSIGRGLRASETKSTATLIDIGDDLTWKSKKNYTMLHFIERIKIYQNEQFKYKVYNIDIV
jgi:superfamily II DNA or RNA helicase